MELISHTAFAVNYVFDCIALGMRQLFEWNYLCVSFFMKIFRYAEHVFMSMVDSVYIVLHCCGTDFLTFLSEVGLTVKFICRSLLRGTSCVVTFVGEAFCSTGYAVYSLYCYVYKLVHGVIHFITIAMDLGIYSMELLVSAILLLLQAIPESVLLLWDLFGYCLNWISSKIGDGIFVSLDLIRISRLALANGVLQIPPKAYIGLTVVFALYYHRIVTLHFLRIISRRCYAAFAMVMCYVKQKLHRILKFVFCMLVLAVVVVSMKIIDCVDTLFDFVCFVYRLLRRGPFRLPARNDQNPRRWWREPSVCYRLMKSRLCSMLTRTNVSYAEPDVPNDVQNLRRELNEERDKRMCIVCQDRERDVILLPCSHFCLCQSCCSTIRRNFSGCPLCRHYILDTLAVFT